jgi:2-hydroxychromene-2-carboxylate isomerase
MSLQSLLMPMVSERLLSHQRLLKARAKAERARRSKGEVHTVHYFHQVDDPYSALLAAQLSTLLQRYDIALCAHVVSPPSESAAPDRERLVAYSRQDAQRLAQRHNLQFDDAGEQPAVAAQERATQVLVAAAEQGAFAQVAATVCTTLWGSNSGDSPTPQPHSPLPHASATQVTAHLTASHALRQRLGHYLGAMLYYAGEWYWGIDRLHHLEQRLQDLGAQRAGVSAPLFPPEADLTEAKVLHSPAPIDFFFSLRSPYSAIVAQRVFDLGRLTGAQVRLRYVLPMVMRGLPVPREKRTYISLDAAREARLRGVPFGRINDPVGRPVERGLSLMPLAERAGKGQAYVLSFMHGVWAQGIDAGSDRGLRRIAERAGLSWSEAQDTMQDQAWRHTAEANRIDMLGLGLWGVPSFCVGDTAVWGQDRLWAIQDALLASDQRPKP